MGVYTFAIAFGLALAFLFRHLRGQVARREAKYKLYAVRDELICLVAEEKLEENSKIFQFYYKRINLLLDRAPNVGIDDSIDIFLQLKGNKDFARSLREAHRRAEEMLDLVEKESKEVSDVIANFYAASKHMMLTHSSVLNFLYVVLIKYHFLGAFKRITKPVRPYIPMSTRRKFSTVRFAANEEDKFRHAFS
ncbi:hypothetical protein [Microbulbifer sp.]|uniref:hypothetical protein n=1 Tax=Microbulbifer sp. TaxID=1908541 RepID=UPI002588C548|nr:hypothetical protein [Microbulbifer sp.]